MEDKDAGSDQSFAAFVKATQFSSAVPGFTIPAGQSQDGTWSPHERWEVLPWTELSSISHQLGRTASPARGLLPVPTWLLNQKVVIDLSMPAAIPKYFLPKSCVVTTRLAHTRLWSLSRYSKTCLKQDTKGNFPRLVVPLVTADMKQDSPVQSVSNPRAEITETVYHLCNSFCHPPSISACLMALMILLTKPLHLSLNSSFNSTDGLFDL